MIQFDQHIFILAGLKPPARKMLAMPTHLTKTKTTKNSEESISQSITVVEQNQSKPKPAYIPQLVPATAPTGTGLDNLTGLAGSRLEWDWSKGVPIQKYQTMLDRPNKTPNKMLAILISFLRKNFRKDGEKKNDEVVIVTNLEMGEVFKVLRCSSKMVDSLYWKMFGF